MDPNRSSGSTACADKTVQLWDAATGEERQLPLPTRARTFSGTFSPDGRMLALGTSDGATYLWEMAGY